MDLETKIGQLFIYRTNMSYGGGYHERDFLRRYRPGGLIISMPLEHIGRQEFADHVADLQQCNAELGLPGPLIVCGNHRGGDNVVLRPKKGTLEFPAAMAQSALAGEAERAGEVIGAAIGRDVIDFGYNLNLAPYADFMDVGEITKTAFGNAMMGADAAANAALSAGLTRGMKSAGLATTYCVFPGGYGSLPIDPHREPGAIDADRDELAERYYLAPTAAFAAGVDAVMLSHYQFPALDPESRPATYSAPVIQDVLRKELGFDGLIMTDSIRMNGVAEVAGSKAEAAILAIEAGADVVLCASWEEHLAVTTAVRSGRISMARLDEAVERVLALKATLSCEVPGARVTPDPVDQGAVAHWIGRSMTWARRPASWQPLNQAPARITAVASWPEFLDAAGEVCGASVQTLCLPVSDARELDEDVEFRLLLSMTEQADRILFGSATPSDLRLAERLQAAGYDVWVAHAGRVHGVDDVPGLPVVLLSYSRMPIASRKAVEVFAGVLDAHGTVPVRLDTARDG